MYHSSPFSRFAKWTARTTGHPAVFLIAVLIILAWAITGPIFRFSDTWQLVINTVTTIVTFLMVFLIQNQQNRDGEAMQVKLDELIPAIPGSHNALLDLEELTEGELDRLKALYEELARRARADLQRGLLDTGTPDVQPGGLETARTGTGTEPPAASLVLFDKDGKVIWSRALDTSYEPPDA
ncbi:MAG: low affinity iron permease family protein [Nitrospinae bacterium]|nr:low affinity iron permease family protein [Nitrospinota bacterium]